MSAITQAIVAMGVKKETTWGTAATPPDIYWIVDPSSNMKVDHEPIEHRGRAGVRAELWKLSKGPKSVSGQIKLRPESENIGQILASFFGAAGSPTSLGSGAYRHAFKPLNTSQLASLTIAVDRGFASPGRSYYTGCVVDQLTFEGDDRGPVMLTADVVGKDESAGASLTPSLSTLEPFVFHQCAVDLNGTNTDVRAWKVALKNNVGLRWGLQGGGTNTPQGYFVGVIEVDLEATLWFESAALRTDWLAATARNFKLTATGASIGGGFSHRLEISLPKLAIGGADFGDVDGAVGLEIKGKGMYDPTGGVVTNASVTIDNTVSTGY